MATVLETAPAPPAEESDSILAAGSGDSVILHGITWKMYCRLRRIPENFKKSYGSWAWRTKQNSSAPSTIGCMATSGQLNRPTDHRRHA